MTRNRSSALDEPQLIFQPSELFDGYAGLASRKSRGRGGRNKAPKLAWPKRLALLDALVDEAEGVGVLDQCPHLCSVQA